MNIELFFAFIGFAFIAAITPGPNNVMILASSAAFGWRRSVPHMLGIAFGFAVMSIAVTLGLGAVLARFPEWLTLVRLLGAAWMLWLAWRLMAPALLPMRHAETDADTDSDGQEDTAPTTGRPLTLIEAALFQWINPKAWTMATAAAAAYSELVPDTVERALIMGGVWLAITPLANGSWMLAGAGLRELTRGKSGRIFNLTLGLTLAVVAVMLAFGFGG